MQKILPQAIFVLALSLGLQAQTAPDAAELTKLVKQFLAGVPSGKLEVYDRFFADDLIYTRSAGQTITKADILKSVQEEAAKPQSGAPQAAYDADDITVHQYGNTAVFAFRLTQHTPGEGDHHFRNTGTFLKRNGKWQVIAWQATRVPDPSPEKTAAEPPTEKK